MTLASILLQTPGMKPGANRLVGLEPFTQVGIIIGGLEFFVHNHQASQYLFGQVVLEFRGQVSAVKYTTACRPKLPGRAPLLLIWTAAIRGRELIFEGGIRLLVAQSGPEIQHFQGRYVEPMTIMVEIAAFAAIIASRLSRGQVPVDIFI